MSAWRTAARLALAGSVLLLAACGTPPKRPEPPPPPAPEPEAVAPAPPEPASPLHAQEASPWERLRARFAFDGCNYRPNVLHEAEKYTANPDFFARSWKEAIPFLLLVLDEVERRDLPGEFALLPYVESGYRPLPGGHGRSRGMWQLTPATARELGLKVDSDYDMRLDALASTSAALDLLERHERRFGDWRAADLAYNSGEGRIARLLAEREAADLSAHELARLHPRAQQHLDRMLALACVVSMPERFDIDLPEPDAGDQLEAVRLEAPMDLRLAARLAGVDGDKLRRWNAAWPEWPNPPEAWTELLLPAPRIEQFRAGAAKIPRELWADWHEETAGRSDSIASWARALGVSPGALASANALAEDAIVAADARLLLPGAERRPARGAKGPPPAGIHVVARGDNPSRIARRYGITLARLRKLNPRMPAILHPGDRVRVAVPAGH